MGPFSPLWRLRSRQVDEAKAARTKWLVTSKPASLGFQSAIQCAIHRLTEFYRKCATFRYWLPAQHNKNPSIYWTLSTGLDFPGRCSLSPCPHSTSPPPQSCRSLCLAKQLLPFSLKPHPPLDICFLFKCPDSHLPSLPSQAGLCSGHL